MVMDDPEELKESVLALAKVFGPNKMKIGRIIGVNRNKIAEILKELTEDGEDIGDIDEEERGEQQEFPGAKQAMHSDAELAAAMKDVQDEMVELRRENERLIKNSERVWHQHQQQQQNSVPSQMEIAQDVLCRMIGDGKLGPSFLKYVNVNRLHGRGNRDREQYIYDVRKNMSKNFLQLKCSLPSIESLICELSSAKSDDEIKQACSSMIRRTDFVTNELKALSTIPINHPRLLIIPDEIAVRLHQDTTMLTDNVFPKLRPSVAVVRTSGKESKYFANIAAALGDLIRIISKIDMYFSQYLIKDNA